MGFLGVGIAEIAVIALIILIVGGPENARKWAYDTAVYIRKIQRWLSQEMAKLDNELGEEGRELLRTTREMGQQLNELRTAPKKALENVSKQVMGSASRPPKTTKSVPPSPAIAPYPAVSTSEPESDKGKVYAAWIPPKNDRSAELAPPSDTRYASWLPSQNPPRIIPPASENATRQKADVDDTLPDTEPQNQNETTGDNE